MTTHQSVSMNKDIYKSEEAYDERKGFSPHVKECGLVSR